MKTSLLATLSRCALVAGIAMLVNAGSAKAVITVTTSGIGGVNAVLNFSTAPAVTEWATGSISGGPTLVTNAATLLTQVQTMAVAGIATTIPINATNNYNGANTFQYQQPAQHLSSTGSAGSVGLLLATLQNTAGIGIASFNAVFDFGIQSAGNDDFPGYGFFYSTTGAANSWVSIGQITTAGTKTNAITLAGGGWTNGSNLYLLWADDNSQANPDGAFTLDNFQVTGVMTVPEPGRATLLLMASSMIFLRRRRR